jgi:predicted DNA-binding transcriptional regulator AlpA
MSKGNLRMTNRKGGSLTSKQVAKFLHISMRTLRRYIAAGRFPKPYQIRPKALWWFSDVKHFAVSEQAREKLMQSFHKAMKNPKKMRSVSGKLNIPLLEKAIAGYIKASAGINVKVTIRVKGQ